MPAFVIGQGTNCVVFYWHAYKTPLYLVTVCSQTECSFYELPHHVCIVKVLTDTCALSLKIWATFLL
ncbi:hypothetical protein HK27_00080 [Acetobacter orientalis]|nr:hypothetical protein HK27_00080 [Acetobacter orientalis]